MQFLQNLQNLQNRVQNCVQSVVPKRSASTQNRRQGSALGVVHHDIARPVGLQDSSNADHVGMLELRQRAGFFQKLAKQFPEARFDTG